MWWSVGGTMQVHHLWEGPFWLRHNKSKVVQTFCHRNAVWEERDIISWNALHRGALQYTHAQMWAGGGGSLSEEQRTKGTKTSAQSVAFCPSPCIPGELSGAGPCCLSEYRSNIISLLIPCWILLHAKHFPGCSTPSILRCIHLSHV